MGVQKTWDDLLQMWGYPPQKETHSKKRQPPPVRDEWEIIYHKFRQRVGRDPYSFQELKDWWHSL